MEHNKGLKFLKEYNRFMLKDISSSIYINDKDVHEKIENDIKQNVKFIDVNDEEHKKEITQTVNILLKKIINGDSIVKKNIIFNHLNEWNKSSIDIINSSKLFIKNKEHFIVGLSDRYIYNKFIDAFNLDENSVLSLLSNIEDLNYSDSHIKYFKFASVKEIKSDIYENVKNKINKHISIYDESLKKDKIKRYELFDDLLSMKYYNLEKIKVESISNEFNIKLEDLFDNSNNEFIHYLKKINKLDANMENKRDLYFYEYLFKNKVSFFNNLKGITSFLLFLSEPEVNVREDFNKKQYEYRKTVLLSYGLYSIIKNNKFDEIKNEHEDNNNKLLQDMLNYSYEKIVAMSSKKIGSNIFSKIKEKDKSMYTEEISKTNITIRFSLIIQKLLNSEKNPNWSINYIEDWQKKNNEVSLLDVYRYRNKEVDNFFNDDIDRLKNIKMKELIDFEIENEKLINIKKKRI